MIPIARNGWISNTISYARIAAVVQGAETRAQSGGVNPACQMGHCEKMMDYVFCGSVKKQYLQYLHEMTLAKMQASESRAVQSTEVLRAQNHRLRKVMTELVGYESALSRLMSGNTLNFCLTASGNPTNWENYLIYRDRRRHAACGLAVPLPAPVPPAPPNPQIMLAPSFNTAAEIRIINLANIRRCGKVVCGNQTFTVRFTNKNEPIVMQDRHNPQADLLREKLFNLWSINKVKERLAEFRRVPLESSKLGTVGERWHLGADDRAENADWIGFTVTVQDRFDRAVSMAKVRLDAQSQLLEAELVRFEQLTVPTRDDTREFLKLQEKIALLKRSRDQVNENIKYVTGKIEQICDGNYTVEILGIENGPIESVDSRCLYIYDTQTRELFKIRLLRFFEQMTQFFMLEMNPGSTEKLRKRCDVQTDLIGRFLPARLNALTDSPLLKPWMYPPIERPEFHTQHEILFNMLKDPAINWTQIDAAMRRMQIEQNDVILTKGAQINLRYLLERRIEAVVTDDQGHGFTVRQAGFDPEYVERMNSIEEIRIALLAPGNYFTRVELDEFRERINHDVTLAEQECSSRGFIERIEPSFHFNALWVRPRANNRIP